MGHTVSFLRLRWLLVLLLSLLWATIGSTAALAERAHMYSLTPLVCCVASSCFRFHGFLASCASFPVRFLKARSFPVRFLPRFRCLCFVSRFHPWGMVGKRALLHWPFNGPILPPVQSQIQRIDPAMSAWVTSWVRLSSSFKRAIGSNADSSSTWMSA
jgi:hypothetical protein